MTRWTFLSNHGRALVCLARNPEMRLREIAAELGVTEQSAYVIVGRLAASGYLDKERDGRRNRYHLRRHLPLPELPDASPAIGEVLGVLTRSGGR